MTTTTELLLSWLRVRMREACCAATHGHDFEHTFEDIYRAKCSICGKEIRY